MNREEYKLQNFNIIEQDEQRGIKFRGCVEKHIEDMPRVQQDIGGYVQSRARYGEYVQSRTQF